MDQKEELEIKKEFQLERIILFSDAVFAIIITIMVIELKLPESIHDATVDEYKREFFKILARLGCYIISFFFVALLWTRHIKFFSYLKDYNRQLLAYNLFFLFCVSLFPFGVTMLTSFKHANSIQGSFGFDTYVVIILLCLFSLTMLAGYMVKHKNDLCFAPDMVEDQLKWKALRINFYLVPVILIILAIVTYLRVPSYYNGYVMAIYGVVNARYSKKYYPKSGNDNKPVMRRLFSRR